MSDSLLRAIAVRAADAGLGPGDGEQRLALGGRDVDAHGVNSGLLRCPRCLSRLVSKCGELRELHGADAKLWVPKAPASDAGADVATADDAYDWAEAEHQWWWLVGSMDDVDNLGLSRTVQTPRGALKLAMCCECQYGPIGHQLDDDPRVWLGCSLLHQQDASLADNAQDFPLPQGVDLGMLQRMIESGMATIQFHVTFDEQRLGMCLADASPESGGGVQVVAFTDMGDGSSGAAERSGKIQAGDKLSRINGKSTVGLEYTGVLDMVIEATRPVTITFERRGGSESADAAQPRVAHDQWKHPSTSASPPS